MLNGKKILVTGGTGSFGQLFIEKTLEKWSPSKIVVFSRDEMKQWEMAKRFNDPRIRYFIGDVRDKERLHRACQGIDYIVHAAAQKIVPSAEYNPIECIRTNIDGAINVVNTAIDAKVKRVVALSTDKACNPINLYGATKLCSDKLFVAGNSYVGAGDTRFSVVRYGNVMGSRGSVIPFFMSIAKTGTLPITDERMTRFMISLDEAVNMVWTALETARGGEIFVKKIPSMKVTDVAQAIAPKAKLVFTGIRPGEKLHEQMISAEDARNTVEYKDYFVILPQIDFLDDRFKSLANEKKCAEGFSYSSDSNTEWMSQEQLQNWIQTNYLPYVRAKEESDQNAAPTQMTSTNDSSEVNQALSMGDAISESAMIAIKSDAEKNSLSRETISLAAKLLKIKDDERMMPDPTKILSVNETFPSLMLAKAIVETRIGKPLEALKTVSSLLVSDPSHLGGKELLSEVNDLLQYSGDNR
jgi:UDP-N-acetylglucosamine 4,6-dehydratase (inverting)